MAPDIETIGVAALFGSPSPARDRIDARILAAASASVSWRSAIFRPTNGCPQRSGPSCCASSPCGTPRKKNCCAGNSTRRKNVYRGWFPLQPTAVSYKEGIDIGPDLAHVQTADLGRSALRTDATAAEETLPGWRMAVAELLHADGNAWADALMHVDRARAWPAGAIFDTDFAGGISTLRLIRYPLRGATPVSTPAAPVLRHPQRQRAPSSVVNMPIPVRHPAGAGRCGGPASEEPRRRMDRRTTADNTLAVNFGQLLERWTDGRVRATRHRVIAAEEHGFDPVLYGRASTPKSSRCRLPAPPLSRSCMRDYLANRRRISSMSGQASAATAPGQGFLMHVARNAQRLWGQRHAYNKDLSTSHESLQTRRL